MESSSGLYDDVVTVYLSMFKQDSPEAAAAIEEILSICGSRAALRATLVITLLKMEVQKNHSVENISIQTHLIKDFPEALPLLERAITCWVHAWGIRHEELLGLINGNPTSADRESILSTLTLPSV
jgi:hypothetical protein